MIYVHHVPRHDAADKLSARLAGEELTVDGAAAGTGPSLDDGLPEG
jgi:hypothetical protein